MSTPCNRKLHSWVPVTGTEFTACRLGFSCDTQCDYTRMVVSCANAIVQYQSQGVCVRTNGTAVQIESAGLKQTYGSQNAMWTVCCICKRSSGDFDINIHQLTIDINWHQYTSIDNWHQLTSIYINQYTTAAAQPCNMAEYSLLHWPSSGHSSTVSLCCTSSN